MRDACWVNPEPLGIVNCRSKQAFLSPWTGSDSEGEGCGDRKQRKRRTVRDSPFEFELACLDPSIFGTV